MNIKTAYEIKKMREMIEALQARVEALENKQPKRGRPPKQTPLETANG